MAEKRVSVKLLGEAKQVYLKLQQAVREEREKGISGSFHQTLLKSVDSKIELLKANYDYGKQIPRKLIPRKYQLEYEVTNLWKIDLAGYWRLVYALKQPQREQTEIEIIALLRD
ncbi:hypothetical protein HY993_04365 [Candidatus Micrarchaeota archaeon]|nr:hypothetical protein [Candidatus Micrarchaeota archaeon]